MNVVFLDIDGVINTYIWDYNERGELKCSVNRSTSGTVNNFQAICWLNELYRLYDFSIVITGTWKNEVSSVEKLQKILEDSGMRPIPVIGVTKTEYDEEKKKLFPRGREIRNYLKEHPEITSFVILDDNSDMEELTSYLVLCNTYVGYGIQEWKQTCELFTLQGVKERNVTLPYIKKKEMIR